jgi:hypothetical protein
MNEQERDMVTYQMMNEQERGRSSCTAGKGEATVYSRKGLSLRVQQERKAFV